MKLVNIIKTSILGAALVAFAGCNDAEYGDITNSVYISEAAPSGAFRQQVENLTIDGGLQTAIHVRLAQTVDYDVNVTIDYAPEFTEEYNTANGTEYLVLPAEYLSFDKKAVIKAGNISSDNINIDIAQYPTDTGAAYCVPLKIVTCDAPFAVSEKSSRILYLLASPHKQVVPIMNTNTRPAGGSSDASDPAAWGITTSEWTLEGWIWMSAFPINNQAIFNGQVSSGTEIYIRFGDANVPYDILQIKTTGSQVETNTKFEPMTWYHLAFVYSHGSLTIYINGEADVQGDFADVEFVINGLELCSSGSYFRANARMAQVRFWSKALSQNTIKDAMNRQVPANSEGLFGYWKLDEGEGSVYYDATGNGRDLKCAVTPSWTSDVVNFSNPNNQ